MPDDLPQVSFYLPYIDLSLPALIRSKFLSACIVYAVTSAFSQVLQLYGLINSSLSRINFTYLLFIA